MDRLVWLKEKREMAEKRYDTIFSLDYDEKWGVIDKAHKKFLLSFLELIPKGITILDAACGTGKYWSFIIEQGYDIMGIDQSQKMLDRAKYKYPDVHSEKIGLQEINCLDKFEGIICVDAMENVSPEEWLRVLKNFHLALKQKGYLYFTVELISDYEIEDAFQKGKKLGVPIIIGEYVHHGGYHYYPTLKQVKDWLNIVGFSVILEKSSNGYHHIIVQKN